MPPELMCSCCYMQDAILFNLSCFRRAIMISGKGCDTNAQCKPSMVVRCPPEYLIPPVQLLQQHHMCHAVVQHQTGQANAAVGTLKYARAVPAGVARAHSDQSEIT